MAKKKNITITVSIKWKKACALNISHRRRLVSFFCFSKVSVTMAGDIDVVVMQGGIIKVRFTYASADTTSCCMMFFILQLYYSVWGISYSFAKFLQLILVATQAKCSIISCPVSLSFDLNMRSYKLHKCIFSCKDTLFIYLFIYLYFRVCLAFYTCTYSAF